MKTEIIENIKKELNNEKFQLSEKKNIKLSYDEKKGNLKIYIPLKIKLGENIPDTAFKIQKKIAALFDIKKKKINIDVIEVFE